MAKPKLRPKKEDLIMSPRELFLYKEDITNGDKSRKEIERRFRRPRRRKV